MYSALTYFGYGKLICKSSSPLDNGKTVSVSDGKKTWSGTMTDGVCVFNALPYKNKYTVYLINGDDVEYSTEVIFGFGDYQEIDVGLDKATWKGLKAIVNAGLEGEMLAVGDQISAMISGEEQVFDIIHIDYRRGTYGNNIILAKHTLLSAPRQMRTDASNVGSYSAGLIDDYLNDEYYVNMPADMKSVISKYTFQVSVGGNNGALQNEEHMVWLPVADNVFPRSLLNGVFSTEVNPGGAERFDYYLTDANRVKKTDAGSSSTWWTASPYADTTTYTAVGPSGGVISYTANGGAIGVCPHFMIAADA